MLADAGVPLGAQTVLLKGVNDDPEIMKRLMHQLLLARVKPYYLYQADLTKGHEPFPDLSGNRAQRSSRHCKATRAGWQSRIL